MKKLLPAYLLVCTLLFFNTSTSAQDPFFCGSNQTPETNKALEKQIQERLLKLPNAPDPNTVYTIPIVFIIYHLGEAEGTGSNTPTAELTGELAKLNDAFRARNDFAGLNDVKIQFALAQYDENCNPISGIVRVDASGIASYAANGLAYPDAAMEDSLRALHNFNDRSSYITIELVHKMTGASGYAGFLEGYVMLHGPSFWYGLMAHELGHTLNLYHTFQGSNGATCPPNTNPDTQGDMVSDTQPIINTSCFVYSSTDINSCTGLQYGDTFNNFMCYSGPCWSKYTPKQIERMRNSVFAMRPKWLNSPALVPDFNAPSALTVLEINSTKVLLTWQTSNVNDKVMVEYRKVGTTPWISAGNSTNSGMYINSLTASTTYEWRVKTACSPYANGGNFSTNNTAPLEYCPVAITSPCSFGISISNILLDGTAIMNHETCGGLSVSPIKSFQKGQSYNFTVNLEAYYNPAQITIWIDFNKDGVFDAVNEKVFNTTAGTQAAISGLFTIPSNNVSVNATRMRIIVGFSSTPTNPCGNIAYGEGEDYLVNIADVCASDLTLVNPTDNYSTGTTIKTSSNSISATNKITNVANVTYSSKSVVLNNGFLADAGTIFKAETGGCN